MMSAAFSPVFFADENALGLGKLLHRRGRDDIVYPGHPTCPKCRSAVSTSTGCPSSVNAASS